MENSKTKSFCQMFFRILIIENIHGWKTFIFYTSGQYAAKLSHISLWVSAFGQPLGQVVGNTLACNQAVSLRVESQP